ncbi:HalOD1 output domain-containing protein [Halomicrobium katesii]|uniref:HalOD1 output domain-containing protein n=1 Tax=Halomicrobium katesii TaxID=437163 RepID=UPI0003722032|nr:HalOD1 output domain-containing protein [Halomicrobium katesii]
MPLTDGPDLTTNILTAIASYRGVDVSDLDFVLHDSIDTAALNALSRHDGGEWTLTVAIDGHSVTVNSIGQILVDGKRT